MPSPHLTRLRQTLAEARTVAAAIPPYSEAGSGAVGLVLDLQIATREREALEHQLAGLAGVLRKGLDELIRGKAVDGTYRFALVIERLEALAGVAPAERREVAPCPSP